MAAWPASLPQKPLMQGFRETAVNLVVRSQTDVGPAKARRRATAGPTTFEMSFRLTSTQLATFRTFVRTDIQDGAGPFTWAHPVTGVPGTFRLIEPPQIVPAGVSWLVGLRVEMLP
ncbi:MAG: hypothetical protein IPK78_18940 [Rhodospirillales bacterium]|nr:hypothetical protein [Rhodospirillales bacterium]